MLERLDAVRKIGLFDQYAHSAGCEFGELTLIYGENGVGKSTVAAILDSLRERNAAEILRRKSLPGDITPTVTVTVGGKPYTFDGKDWSDQLPFESLDVFYPGFVTRNVHAATAVQQDQRRNLCELVLGREAVKRVARLAAADTEGRAALADRKQIERQLELIIKAPDTLDTYAALPHDAAIDAQLERVRTELKEAQGRDATLARPVPKPVASPAVDGARLVALVELSAEALGADTATQVQEHIGKHLDKDGEKWLAYGAGRLGPDSGCPFCGQNLAGSTLVEYLRSYFSEEYRAHIATISSECEALREQLGMPAFLRVRAACAAQLALAAPWAGEFPIDQSAAGETLARAETSWKSASEKLEGVLAKRLGNPLDRMDSVSAEDVLAEYGIATDLIAEVSRALSACGTRAEARQVELAKTNTADIEARLRRLENQKSRFEPLAQELLKKRNEIIEKRKTVEDEKARLKKEIDEHAATVVRKYQDGINHYLEYFGCDIRIASVQSGFPSGRASVQYSLRAHGHEIELGVSETGPCFETVLSEGDKYTLALAFFFARLKEHKSLAGTTVVLDDPVNSLGSSRRGLVVGVTQDLRRRGAQVVVLTHDTRLAAMIWRSMGPGGIASLQVERTNAGSRLAPWDIERATRSRYVEDYLTLMSFLEGGGDHGAAARCVRPYVEQRLRHMFPGPPLSTRDTLGQMIAKIRGSAPGTRLSALLESLPDLEAIEKASLPSHHASDDAPHLAPLTPGEVRIYAQKALDVLN